MIRGTTDDCDRVQWLEADGSHQFGTLVRFNDYLLADDLGYQLEHELQPGSKVLVRLQFSGDSAMVKYHKLRRVKFRTD